jgi:hypothetical protein
MRVMNSARFAALHLASSAALLLVGVFSSLEAFSQMHSESTEHFGICDASAAAPVGPDLFVVANDEDSRLRLYRRDVPGQPMLSVDLAGYLKLDRKSPESDVEGAARVGDRIYWITSHGASAKGKRRPNRQRFFATDVSVSGQQATLKPVGEPYSGLLKDLAAAPALERFELAKAASIAPETKGGLNIEGLAATPQGSLLIGFRSPVPGGKALVVPLENPDELLHGRPAQLGPPMLLSLDGRGIRAIEYFGARGEYLIVAGPHGDEGTFRLYRWSGRAADAAQPIEHVDFAGLQPEALVIYPDERERVQVLSDDGARPVGGKACKDERVKPESKSFRSVWIRP